MQIKIRVITNAKKERIIKSEDIFKVYVSSPPIEGRANQRVAELLSEYFKVKKSQITIISGLKSKEKTIQIDS